MGYIVYIGTNSVRNSRGIYTLAVSDDGKASVTGTTEAYNSGYLVLNRDGTRLYAVSEGMSFKGAASGGVLAYDISEGAPELINYRFSGGQRPCCIALSEDGQELYCANFFGGTISVFPIEEDGALGEMRRIIKETPLPGRLDGMHCVEPLPNGEVGAVYLGTGSVIIYDAESFAEKQRFSLDNGAFPRHFAVSESGRALYLLLQTPSELHTALRGEDGVFRVKSVLSAVPEDYAGAAEAAAVRITPNGELLFASTRIANTVAVYRIDKTTGLPEVSDIVSLPVKTPRDICVSPDGKFLFTTGQASDNICIHEIDYAAGTLRLCSVAEGIVSPGCIVVKGA